MSKKTSQVTDAADARRRQELITECNGALAEMDALRGRLEKAIEGHEKALNAAKAEIGTAKAEYAKASKRYTDARNKLSRSLPGWTEDEIKEYEEAEKELRAQEDALKNVQITDAAE